MIEFFFADINTGYAIALISVLALAFIEGIGMLIGLSMMNLLDQVSPFELDLDVDADMDFTTGGLTSLLGWLCLNRLPLLIWLVLFLTCFGISGYSVNYFFINNFSVEIPIVLSYIIALSLAILFTRYLGQPLSKLLPKN